MPTPDANGNPDSFFISRVRRMLRDQPVVFPDIPNADGAAGAPWLFANSKSIRLQRAPVIKSFSPLISAPGSVPGEGTPIAHRVSFDPVAYNSGGTPAAPALAAVGGGTWPAGTYTFAFIQSTSAVIGNNSLPQPIQPGVTTVGLVAVTLAANQALQIGAQTGLPASVFSVETYLVSSTNAAVGSGRVAQQLTVGGATTLTTVTAPPGLGTNFHAAYVNSDTGELTFLAAPITGTIQASYQAARFSDQEVTDRLYEGLYQLFPEVWQPQVDTSLLYSPTQTEYTLPAVFNNPDVHILLLEMQPPSGILISLESGLFRRPSLTNLVFSRAWPSGSVIRLTFNQPYQVLSDLETELMHAPCYWAAAMLLLDQDSTRTRANDLQALTGEGAVQPGQASQLAQVWLTQFNAVKNTRARNKVTTSQVHDRAVELLESRRDFSWNPV